MRRFLVYLSIAVTATIPGLVYRFSGITLGPLTVTLICFAALLGAGFLLSWSAEAAEEHASQTLIIRYSLS